MGGKWGDGGGADTSHDNQPAGAGPAKAPQEEKPLPRLAEPISRWEL